MAIKEKSKGDDIKSALLFEKATVIDPQNELICYKFAESLIGQGKLIEAEMQLDKSLAINPAYDQALVLKGDFELKKGNKPEAASFYEKAIVANRKYFSVYPKLAAIYAETNASRAHKVLGECLKINPHFKPAIQGMADLYRKTNPEKAEKFDELIDKLK